MVGERRRTATGCPPMWRGGWLDAVDTMRKDGPENTLINVYIYSAKEADAESKVSCIYIPKSRGALMISIEWRYSMGGLVGGVAPPAHLLPICWRTVGSGGSEHGGGRASHFVWPLCVCAASSGRCAHTNTPAHAHTNTSTLINTHAQRLFNRVAQIIYQEEKPPSIRLPLTLGL